MSPSFFHFPLIFFLVEISVHKMVVNLFELAVWDLYRSETGKQAWNFLLKEIKDRKQKDFHNCVFFKDIYYCYRNEK